MIVESLSNKKIKWNIEKKIIIKDFQPSSLSLLKDSEEEEDVKPQEEVVKMLELAILHLTMFLFMQPVMLLLPMMLLVLMMHSLL